VIGLAVILGIIGLQVLDDSGDGSTSGATSTTAVGTVTTGPTTTTVAIRPTSAVRVKVYNASGIQGKAQTLTDQLKGKGYATQEPTTLSGSHQGTVVECVAGFQREGYVLAVSGVGGAQIAPYPKDPPDGASDADCIVVIGNA
jgi:hypothetical protein